MKTLYGAGLAIAAASLLGNPAVLSPRESAVTTRPHWRSSKTSPYIAPQSVEDRQRALTAAEEKRARKAAKRASLVNK